MKKYDFDFKISVVEAYKNGLSYKEIREKFHVTKTCFYDWLKLSASVAFDDSTIAQMNFGFYPSRGVKFFPERFLLPSPQRLPKRRQQLLKQKKIITYMLPIVSPPICKS